jgi:N utilization substance protein B
MAAKSRRKAREAALRALYEIELGGTFPGDAIEEAAQFAQLDPNLSSYLSDLVWGVEREKSQLDKALGPLLHKYQMDRLASIDRNLLRLAAYEISFVPAVPAPVSIDEAIELAKRFSTAESGRFVNGVLAKYLSLHPKETGVAEPEESHPAEEPEIENETVTEDSPVLQEAQKLGAWRLREAESE